MKKVLITLTIIIIFILLLYQSRDKYSKDLLEHKIAANIINQTEFLRFGENNYSTHILLLEGWSNPEKIGDTSLRWAIGNKSKVNFFSVVVKNFKLVLKAMPFEANDHEKQAINIYLNNNFINSVNLKSGWNEYVLLIGKEKLRLGFNQLVFIYKYSKQPIKFNINEDNRYLSVAFEYIKFIYQNDEKRVINSNNADINLDYNILKNDVINLPSLTSLEYLLRIPKDARLKLEMLIDTNEEKQCSDSYFNVWMEDAKGKISKIINFKSGKKEKPPKLIYKKVKLKNKKREIVKLYFANTINDPNYKIIIKKLSLEGDVENEEVSASPNVVLMLLDALRPDHLSVYQHKNNASPHIDNISEDSVVFKNAYTQSTFTREAVASLLTSLYPLTHNVGYIHKMSYDITTVPEILKQFDYQTTAFTANGFINKDSGILQGFDKIIELFRYAYWGPHNSTPAEAFIPAFDEWLLRNYKGKFFIYMHFMQPHEPYQAPKSFRIFSYKDKPSVLDGSTFNRNKVKEKEIAITSDDIQHMKNLYDDNIYYIDYIIGKLIHKLYLLDLYQNTMIIILSDHGDEFMEHGGFSHSMHLYDECLHIPLIIKTPNALYKKKIIKSMAQLIDIGNTILDVLGTNRSIGQGKSLFPLISDSSGIKEIHSAIYASRKSFIALRTYRYKYIEDTKTKERQLYDVIKDQTEQFNIANSNADIVQQLSNLLSNWYTNQKPYIPQPAEEIDEHTKEILRSLGYLR